MRARTGYSKEGKAEQAPASLILKPSIFPCMWGQETTRIEKVNIQGEQVFIFKPVHSTLGLLRKVKFHTLNPRTCSLQSSLDKWICLC